MRTAGVPEERAKTVAPELKPIKVVSPWHMIGVDLIRPFMKSRNVNNWCLTATDHFTKWMEVIPIKDLGVLPNTQTWIHLMSSTTNHPSTFHYIIYSYCCCHYLLRKIIFLLYHTGHIIFEIHRLTKNTNISKHSSAWNLKSPSSIPPSETAC